MDNSVTSIAIRNLSKTFKVYEDRKDTLRSLFVSFFNQGRTKKLKILDSVNLDIKKGDFLGVLGRNGSGKSTLLKLIAGIYAPDKGGTIEFLGRLVPFIELGVGFNPELTGRENVFLNGTIIGMSMKALEEKFNDIVDFAELKDFIDMPVKNYSSGMVVRLAFSIAVQSDADIFLLDEVLGVGDTYFQQKSIEIIKKFKEQGKTIIYVSHNLDSVIQYCSRAILLENSKLVMDGNPADVVERYKNSFQ